MLSTKANTICILEILKEYSDEQHILTMSEIISKMNIVYGLKLDRRTVYSSVALLIDLGYDISVYEENGVGYFLRKRELEQSEVLLLTDAVYSFPFLPAKHSEQLIAKLQTFLSKHQRKRYRHLTIVRQEHKTENRQVFLNVELLDEAISEKKQVSFTYLAYGADKKLHPRRETPYKVNPYGMVYMNEHYYLVCNLSGYPNTSLYRIDMMQNLARLDTPWDREPSGKEEVSNAVYAFSGQPERIVLRCQEDLIGDVIDQFGTEIFVAPDGDGMLSVSFSAPPRGIKYWALQYLSYVEVLHPQWLREEIVESVKNCVYNESTTK